MISLMVVQVSRLLITRTDLSLSALGSEKLNTVHYCLKTERQKLELRVLVSVLQALQEVWHIQHCFLSVVDWHIHCYEQWCTTIHNFI